MSTHEPQVSAAFLSAIDDLVSGAQITRIIRALERGDIQTAMDALHISDAAFDDLIEAMAAAYRNAGQATAAILPTAQGLGTVVFRFANRNPAAQEWLRNESARRVSQISEAVRETVRVELEAGLSRGDAPRRTALNLVGRIDETGRRTGGSIGLSAQQKEWVTTARERLESGDAAKMRAYLRSNTKRDKRFDQTVEKAIREGRKLNQDQVDKIVGRYSDRLLKARGDAIARTETLQSIAAGQHRTHQQAIEEGLFSADQVTKIWKSGKDLRVRGTHSALHNDRMPFAQPFRTFLGNRLMHPGDTALGARPEDIVNCRCIVEYKIDFTKGVQ